MQQETAPGKILPWLVNLLPKNKFFIDVFAYAETFYMPLKL